MSAKWRRSKLWDDEHLRGPMLVPVRWTLRALSSITMAVVLLTLVGVYGALASVPIGLLALTPTWIVIGVSVLVVAGTTALGLGWAARRFIPGAKREIRFTATIFAGLVGVVVGTWAWSVLAWPLLRYDPVSATGLRFFPDVVGRYESVTLRRLPGIELTELEFYSAWPLRLILVLFVANMVIATVRRIEFTFKNIGVLTVHAGIVVISLGSVYYQALKQEGDTILLAGARTAEGVARAPAQDVFYDATRVVVWARQLGAENSGGGSGWEQRRVKGLPRYNSYWVGAGLPERDDALLSDAFGVDSDDVADGGRDLSIDVPARSGDAAIDSDIGIRVVGYAPYAELRADVKLYSRDEFRVAFRGVQPRPVRDVEVSFPSEHEGQTERPVLRLTLTPDEPVQRVKAAPGFALEMTRGMNPSRWSDLTTPTPPGASDVLVVEIPKAGVRVVIPAAEGQAYTIGRTGWEVAVRRFLPEPPFPIITAGYEDATSSVAILRITEPEGTTYDRWVYSRFPEITQDVFAAAGGGRPTRRDAGPSIRVGYLDVLDGLDVHVEETTTADNIDPRWRMAVRQPDGSVRTFDSIKPGASVDDVFPGIGIAIREGWFHGEGIERPIEIAPENRETRFIGTHDMAKVALEVSVVTSTGEPKWSDVIWVPFTRYMGLSTETLREIGLPDGRAVALAFGRLRRTFPGFALRLVDFEMVAYDHRGAPRDYQSRVEVVPTPQSLRSFDAYERIAKLNAPLRAPFVWDDGRSWLSNATLRATSGLDPDQYKISQAGWDQAGWQESQAMADQGIISEPFARFTIMQVGNNPGIHVIAVGGVMMGIGIPWAFYLKPWLLRREKARLAAKAARDRTASG
ncbi:MAG: hypothetical protein AAGI53_13015 [Planctomycetota bacterium]